MKNIIKKGMSMPSEEGYIVFDGYNGSIVDCTEHYTDCDGTELETHHRMLTLFEVGKIMKFFDGLNHEVRWEEDEEPCELTIESIKDKYGLNTKQISNRFEIPYRTVQNWMLGLRACPQYVVNMMDEILSKEDNTIIKLFSHRELVMEGTFAEVKRYLSSEYKDCKDVFDIEDRARELEDNIKLVY